MTSSIVLLMHDPLFLSLYITSRFYFYFFQVEILLPPFFLLVFLFFYSFVLFLYSLNYFRFHSLFRIFGSVVYHDNNF